MIISHKHKFIFIKCPKTAGTSIQATLAECCGPDDIISSIGNIEGFLPQNHGFPDCNAHTTPTNIRKLVGEKIWDSYFKIVCVRNPFDIMVSWWHWHLKPGDFSEFIEKTSSLFNDFWLSEPIDYFIRFEYLNKDYKTLCELLNLSYKVLPHHINFRKATNHYSTYYDDETRELIRNKYKCMINKFDYDFSKC